MSSHRDYGKRLALSFNKEIHSQYYQNMSVSVEGSSLEWIDEGENGTLDILAIGQMIRSRMLLPPHTTCVLSYA